MLIACANLDVAAGEKKILLLKRLEFPKTVFGDDEEGEASPEIGLTFLNFEGVPPKDKILTFKLQENLS
jgi:hypothetical protein